MAVVVVVAAAAAAAAASVVVVAACCHCVWKLRRSSTGWESIFLVTLFKSDRNMSILQEN
jgi:uncharacterized membrane protein YqjE